ncbi:MAG: alpha/beta hydrolase [bacterium]|nr:alpha/beta hydrolase [bacterium]
MYNPIWLMESTPSEINLPYREVSLETPDRLRLYSWFVGDDEERDVLLYCHGNYGNISHRNDHFSIFHQLGLRVFIFDYRGYGRSAGKLSEKGTYRDAETAWQYLVETEGIPPERIILYGRSLGGPVAARLAGRVNAKALILESTFASIPHMARELYPFFPRVFVRYRYNTLGYIRDVHIPLLVIHGPEDEITPFSHGKAVFSVANEPKQFIKISGTHNQGFLDSEETYCDGLKEFLSGLKPHYP